MPANVSGWTATSILMDTATSLRLTAARTTSTASVIATTWRHTPTPRASTCAEFISMDVAITKVIITWLWQNECYNRIHYAGDSYVRGVDENNALYNVVIIIVVARSCDRRTFCFAAVASFCIFLPSEISDTRCCRPNVFSSHLYLHKLM